MFPQLVTQLRAGQPHAPVPLAFRLLSSVLKLAGTSNATTATDEELIAEQKPFPRNAMTNLLFGEAHRDVLVSNCIIAGEDGPLLMRSYRPRNASGIMPAVLYMHGGGWVSGDVGMTDWWCSRLSHGAGVAVFSLAYRLAPTHRFPKGLEDCFRALCEIQSDYRALGIDPDRIRVAGDSAGANLAAALCLLSRQERGPEIESQTLIYPALDFDFHSPSITEEACAPLLTANDVKAYVAHYLGPDDASSNRCNPLASPLRASNLGGLPPAHIQVAEHDPLRDDGWRYADRLQRSGVPATVVEYPGAVHGFALFRGLSAITTRALQDAIDFQRAPIPRQSNVINLASAPTSSPS